MKEMVKSEALHPVWTCELWRRHHLGEISTPLKEAGDMWILLVREHRKFINDPPGGATISKLERGYGRNEIDVEALNKESQDAINEWNERLKRRWDQAYITVIDRKDGIQIMRAVNALCLDDEHLDYSRFLLAKQGLEILAKHFGLTTRGKSE